VKGMKLLHRCREILSPVSISILVSASCLKGGYRIFWIFFFGVLVLKRLSPD
jgi:hypothetical protein